MFIRCVVRPHTERQLVASACIALVLAVWSSTPHAAGSAVQRKLFVLAGTPTAQSPLSYPVNLYTVTGKNKLKLVRRIASASVGLFAAVDDEEGRIYIAFPHTTPTTVSVIHELRPAEEDKVTFNSNALTLDSTALGVSVGTEQQSYLLCPMLQEAGQGEGRSVMVSLVAVAGGPHTRGQRAERGDWSLYHRFRYEGAPGGPMGAGFAPLAYIKGNYVFIQVSPPGRPFRNAPQESEVELDNRPPDIPIGESSGPFYIVAASNRFFVIASTPGHLSVYIHDRVLNKWTELHTDATVPYARRVFGPWLATIVERWRPGDPANAESPGCDNERNWGTRLMPNVREAYACGQTTDVYIPGALTLDNLIDRRRIEIHTGQEDSEILDVRSDGLVLYRVNDSIYSAQIEGDNLSAPTLVVKDDDVPEIHWAFWSEGAVESSSATRPPTSR